MVFHTVICNRCHETLSARKATPVYFLPSGSFDRVGFICPDCKKKLDRVGIKFDEVTADLDIGVLTVEIKRIE